jgi:hypothetical protein
VPRTEKLTFSVAFLAMNVVLNSVDLPAAPLQVHATPPMSGRTTTVSGFFALRSMLVARDGVEEAVEAEAGDTVAVVGADVSACVVAPPVHPAAPRLTARSMMHSCRRIR